MTYLEHVTTYFVSLVGKGVTLSSRDLAIVRRWETAGIPASAVCRALGRAVAARRDSRGRTALADYADAVAGMASPGKSGQSDRRAAATEPTPARLLARLAQVGPQAPSELVKHAYREIYKKIRVLPERPLTIFELDRLDHLAVSAYTRGLPVGRYRVLRQELRQRARRLLGSDASRAAVDRLAASLLEREFCEKHGLILPSALVCQEDEP